MHKLKLLLFPILLLLVFDSAAQEEWKLGKDKDGIKVYTRKVEGHKLKAVKAKTVINANIKDITAIIADFNNHCKWVDNCAVSKIVSDTEKGLFFYNTYSTPWPAKDRDAITKITFPKRNDELVSIKFTGAPDYLDVNEDFVRVPYSEGSWLLKRIDDHSTEITYKIHVDSGGSIPKWMVNELIIKSPFSTIDNLRSKFTPN